MARIIDISPPVSAAIAVWPGDTPFTVDWAARLEEGDSTNTATVRTTPHLGAHADGPLHYEHDAPGIGEVDLEPYLGRCRVVDVTGSAVVDEEAVFGHELHGAERILFRTGTFPDYRSWNDGFAWLAPDLVRRLGKMGVKLVGIDTPSVDAFDSKELPTHHVLAGLGMRNLEGLDLSRAEEGDYELIALPLPWTEVDSSPVRAVLRTLD